MSRILLFVALLIVVVVALPATAPQFQGKDKNSCKYCRKSNLYILSNLSRLQDNWKF